VKLKKKSKRAGFTLVELLGLIIIFGLLIAIAFPAVSRYVKEIRNTAYTLHEGDMKTAAANMMSECVQNDSIDCVPEKGESKTVYLSELIDTKYTKPIRDPGNEAGYCKEDESYVIVTNTSNNVVDLDYEVCLKCSNYQSGICKELEPGGTCDKTMDQENPVCGEVVGESTVWTNEDRIISVKCSDNGCGCTKGTFYKTFNETTTTGTIQIVDKAGNKTGCPAVVYVDKELPTCELEIEGNKGENGWYGTSTKPVVKIKKKNDGQSGIATYGIGVSSKNYDFNKKDTYTVESGITTVFGYVQDNAGNIGTCHISIKYDPVKPTIENVEYGTVVYPKSDIAKVEKINQVATITLAKDILKEYGEIYGLYVYQKSTSNGTRIGVTLGNTTLKNQVTLSKGVTEPIKVMFESPITISSSDLVIAVDSEGTALTSIIEKIEVITKEDSGYYTNQNVTIYVTTKDSLSGKASYTFDGKNYTDHNYQSFSHNQTVNIRVKDYAGNISDVKIEDIVSIDKLDPNDTIFTTNGGEYTMNVGETEKTVSTTIVVNDAKETTANAESGIRKIYYGWTKTPTQPTSWSNHEIGSSRDYVSSGGSNYLWIKIVDKAGNATVTMSNKYNVGYQVTYNCNGGSGCPDEQRKIHGINLLLSTVVPTRSGYTFMGWGTSATTNIVTYSGGSYYRTDEPEELFAIWAADTPGGYPAYTTTGTIYTWRASSVCTAEGKESCNIEKCSGLGVLNSGETIYVVGKDTDNINIDNAIYLYAYIAKGSVQGNGGYGIQHYNDGKCDQYDSSVSLTRNVDGSETTLPAMIEFNNIRYFLARVPTYCENDSCSNPNRIQCDGRQCENGWITTWDPRKWPTS